MASELASLQSNRLLQSLSASDLALLTPHLRPRSLQADQVLYEVKQPMEEAYFPLTAVLSAVTILSDGDLIEVGTVGKEGAVGIAAFPRMPAVNRVFVQIPGQAAVMNADTLTDAMHKSDSLGKSMAVYQSAFLAQVSRSVACNGLHNIEQRCGRWLLMTADRVGSNAFPLTHEYLSYMLGVRRSGVSEVLHSLKERQILNYTRGSITILDREGLEAVTCECYQVVRDYYQDLYRG